MDKRHTQRIARMQLLFSHTFLTDHPSLTDLVDTTVDDRAWLKKILPLLPEIDQEIAQFAPERPLADINKVDLSIMRLIVFEWKTQATPPKVLIDEAVILAKEFGSDNSPKFVNGVLAKVLLLDEPAADGVLRVDNPKGADYVN